MKRVLQIIITCMGALFLLVSCSKEAGDILPDGTTNRLLIETNRQDFLFEESAQSRTSTNGNTTAFVAGDAIGVFAIQNGSVMPEYNNVKLTYNGHGGWTGADIYNYNGTSFIAYYPYRSDMSGKTSVDAIKSAFPIQNDQSSVANFESSNLLTSQATVSNGVLSFNFTPAFAMVEVNLPERIRGYSNAAGENLTYDFYGVNVSAPSFNITFCNVADRTYRRIIKPSTATEIKVSYSLNGKKTLTYTKQMNIAVGKYKKMVLGTLSQNILKGAYAYRQNDRLVFLLNGVSNDNKGDCFGVVFQCSSSKKYIVAKNDAGDKFNWYEARDGNAITNYQASNPCPATGTSGWFLPGLFDWFSYEENKEVDAQLITLGDKSTYGVTQSGSGINKNYHYSGSPTTNFSKLSNEYFAKIVFGNSSDVGCVRFFCTF